MAKRIAAVVLGLVCLWSWTADGQTTIQRGRSYLFAVDGSASAPSVTFGAELDNGFYRAATSKLCWAEGGSARHCHDGSGSTWDFAIDTTSAIRWGLTAGTADLWLFRDGAAAILAQKNGANAQTFRIYGTTTGPKYLSLSHDGTNGVIDTAASSGTLSLAPTNASSVTIGKAISSLNGLATTANGVPLVVAQNRATAQSGAAASVVTYTPTADASFEISSNVLVTTATNHTFTATCTYTDEGNTSRTATMSFLLVAGGTVTTSIANAAGAVPYMGIPQRIRAKASTAITCQTTGTFTTVTYNVEFAIVRF